MKSQVGYKQDAVISNECERPYEFMEVYSGLRASLRLFKSLPAS